MAMRLRVVGEHARRLGPLATKVFGVHGGTIGRAIDNEWALPDPERYLSGKHARIDFRAGQYFVVDCSSNGTYVNGAQQALGKSNEHALKDGDYLRLGDFELLVSIDASNDFPPDECAVVAFDGINPSAAMKKSTANDLGAVLDLSELLERSDSPGSASLPAASEGYGGHSLLDDAGTPWHMQTRPIRVARREPQPDLHPFDPPEGEPRTGEASFAHRIKSSPFAEADGHAGFAAMCRGAGIDADRIPAEQRTAALQLCGRVLREMAVGLLELAQSNNEVRNRFRIDLPDSDLPDSHRLFERGIDEALLRLLTTTTVHGNSADAVREFVQSLKAHHVAASAGMQAGFEEFVSRLDPKELAERFEQGAKRGVFGSPNKSRHWELYADLYATLAQRAAGGFPHSFNEAFARAFTEKLIELLPLRGATLRDERSDAIARGEFAAGNF